MSKQVKFSEKRYADLDTGEEIVAQVITQTGDYDFEKLWMAHILDAIEEIGNAKMQVLWFLLKKRDYRNQIDMSVVEIAKATGVGEASVKRCIWALQRHNIIKRKRTKGTTLTLNPDVIFKGSHQQRTHIVYEYKQVQGQLFDLPEERKKRAA
jgi:hypothetical protein